MRSFLELLLAMAVGHAFTGNPFFGAAVFLFANIVKTYLFCNISKLRHANGASYTSVLLLMLVAAAGLALAFLYPYVADAPAAGLASLTVMLIIMRDALCSMALYDKTVGKVRLWFFLILVQILFNTLCLVLFWRVASQEEFCLLAGLTVLTGIIRLVFPDRILRGPLENRFEQVSSYQIFTNMNLYATIAMDLGVMMCFLLGVLIFGPDFSYRIYLYMVVWLAFVNVILEVGTYLIRRQRWTTGLSGFILGAVCWVVGFFFLSRTRSPQGVFLWVTVWGGGMAILTASIRRFQLDFAAIGEVTEDLGVKELKVSNIISSTVAYIVSSSIMLVIVALGAFLPPDIEPGGHLSWPENALLLLPVGFMLVALVFALVHPLDKRNREKLMLFIDSRTRKERVRESLQNMLVRKYRIRASARLVCFFLRPFLRLRVSGLEKLRKDEYPSVFVCNHGFMYGPVAATIYLPTYFRPWIHDVMLSRQSATEEIAWSFPGFLKVTGKRLGMWIISQAAAIVSTLMSAFYPIPVVRGTSRDLLKTFSDSITALEEGDNLLIFPERPGARTRSGVGSQDEGADELREFFTGFAHLGKMYYDQTGQELLFYPLYCDRKDRAFRIGDPVRYDSSLPSREGKQALAQALHLRIVALATKSSC